MSGRGGRNRPALFFPRFFRNVGIGEGCGRGREKVVS